MRRRPRAEEAAFRRICVNQAVQPYKYRNNYVATTKYNLLTFLPKALYEQFRCTLGCLQAAPCFSSPSCSAGVCANRTV